ncbi:Pol polyprotein [Plakobranchus ocellatus]|uniref:Pol polyprotein n=1 Tax=Plakobranchus ocellatus TaxID=259542 RepID=A0AAV3Z998_9GAST|nr:Pol polyprotein [Plakobranchus ocellatus]
MRSTNVSTPYGHGTSGPRLHICLPRRYLVASSSAKSDIDDINVVFHRLRHHGLIIKREKCLFGVSSLDFMGRPKCCKGFSSTKRCQSASRVLWYNELLPRFHPQPRFNPAPPLPSHKHIQTASSSQLDQRNDPILLCKQMLVHPCTDCPIALTCDASDVAIIAVLEQYAHGRWEPLAFFSRQLRKPEIKYSTFVRELLGVHLTTCHFRYMLEGRQFTIYTDHKPYGCSANLECNGQSYNTALTNLQITNTKLIDQGPELLWDISTGRARPIVPPDFRRSVFEAVYNVSHSGVKPTVKLVSEQFVWHGLRLPVSTWVKECHECQSSKIQKHTRAPLQTFTVPEKRSSHIKIDIVGPLPESCGYRYLMTIIDRNTRWEDLGYSSAELVYGEPLTVPGEFTPFLASPWSATEFLTAFRAKTQLLKPRPTIHHSKPHTYLPPSLLTAKYVYKRTDTVKTPLQRPYTGPYTVLAPGEKTFLVDMGGRAERISIDRLKPAQVNPTKPVQLQPPARRGRPPALPGPSSATETDDTRGQPLAQTHHNTYGTTSATACALPVTL